MGQTISAAMRLAERRVVEGDRQNGAAASQFHRTSGVVAKQLIALFMAFSLTALLGSCSPFAGFVADHWPHWAGGLPSDAPPRRGAPGYGDFIGHGEAAKDAPAAPAADNKARTPTTPAQAGTAQAAAPVAPAPNDPTVGQGGLY
jgi:hypothetical protein